MSHFTHCCANNSKCQNLLKEEDIIGRHVISTQKYTQIIGIESKFEVLKPIVKFIFRCNKCGCDTYVESNFQDRIDYFTNILNDKESVGQIV